MKNKLYVIVAMVSMAFLFGSCKSLTNFSIEKRQHRGGYYVDWGNGKVKTEQEKKAPATARVDKSTQTTTPATPSAPATAKSTETPSTIPASQPSIAAPAAMNKSEAPSRNTIRVKDVPMAWTMEEVKEAIDYSYSQSENSGYDRRSSDTPDWVLAVLCILLPPLAVFLKVGIGSEFWISILLTLLFWIPGVIYAFIICF